MGMMRRFVRWSNDVANDAWLGQTADPVLPPDRHALSFVRRNYFCLCLSHCKKSRRNLSLIPAMAGLYPPG